MKPIKTLVAITFLAGTLAALPTSHANDKGKGKKTSSSAVKAKAVKVAPKSKKVKNYDFMADDIDGSRIRPDGTAIFGMHNLKHGSLIRLRSEFIAEIIKSAETL